MIAILMRVLILLCVFLLPVHGNLPVPSSFVNQNPGEFLNATQNYVGRWIFMSANITSTDVTLTVYNPPRAPSDDAAVLALKLADLSVKTVTKTVTLADLKTAKTVSLPFTVSATPNPKVTGGYQVELQIYSQRIDLNTLSPTFFQFQANALTYTTTNVLVERILFGTKPAKKWIIEAVGLGTILAPDYSNTNVIQIDDSFGSTTPVTVSMTLGVDYAFASQVQPGIYWFTIFSIMSPFSVSNFSTQLTTIDNEVNPALGSIISLISTVNGQITTYSLTSSETAIALANRLLLQKEGIELIDASIIRYDALLPLATTTAEVAEITSRVAALNAIKVTL